MPDWLGLTEGLIMLGVAGITGALAYLSGAGTGTTVATAIIAAVAGKFIYRQWKK